MKFRLTLLVALCATFFVACGGPSEQVVNVYTHRHYDIDKELFAKFTELTGIKVNVVKASADQLINRLETEAENSPADVLISVDAGRLHRAKQKGLLQPFTSDNLQRFMPQHLRDSDNQWVGLTVRARVIVYAKDRVQPAMLSTYEDLADKKWRGKIMVRSSGNIYNQSLLASMIAHKGPEAAESWAKAVVQNMAQNPKGGDRDQIRAVAAGAGDVAIVNTYYLGRMLGAGTDEEKAAAQKVGVFFPNQDGRGAHINVSAAGVTRHAPNRRNAQALIEFLCSDHAQQRFAEGNFEYPAKPGVEVAETLKAWGSFKRDTLVLSKLGDLNAEAVRIFDRAGWK